MPRSVRVRLAKGLAFFCCLPILVASAGCRIGLPNDCTGKCAPNAPPISAEPVVFDASVTYADALRGMTNLGVQPGVFCGYPSDVAAGRVIGSSWLPAGQRDRFEQEHLMWVVRTIIAAPDWAHKLSHLPGFHKYFSSQNFGCSDGNANVGPPPPKGAPDVLTREQAGIPIGTYTHVSFAANIDYDTVLYDISNLGLRLASPCYEESLLPHHQPQTWLPLGQEITFHASNALIVAPAPVVSAVTWRNQLRKLPDVTAVDSSYHSTC